VQSDASPNSNIAPTASAKAAALSEQLAQAIELARSASPLMARASTLASEQAEPAAAVAASAAAAAGLVNDGSLSPGQHTGGSTRACGLEEDEAARQSPPAAVSGAIPAPVQSHGDVRGSDADDAVAAGTIDVGARGSTGAGPPSAQPAPAGKGPAASGSSSPAGQDVAAGDSDKPRRHKGRSQKRHEAGKGPAGDRHGSTQGKVDGHQPSCSPCSIM
jgi:hypothetical protein